MQCVQCLSRQTLHTGAKAKSGWVAIWEGGRVAHFHRSRRKQIHVLSDGKKTGVCLVRFLLPWNMLKVEQICDLCHRRGKSTWLHYCQGEEIDHGIRGGWEWWRPVFRCCRTDFKLWHFFWRGRVTFCLQTSFIHSTHTPKCGTQSAKLNCFWAELSLYFKSLKTHKKVSRSTIVVLFVVPWN